MVTAGTLTVPLVAGCVGGNGGESDGPNEDEDTDDTEAETDEPDEETDGSEDANDEADGGDGGDEGLASFGTPVEPQPSLEPTDANVDDPLTTLEVKFNGGAFSELVDGDQFWEAESGEMFLLLQVDAANTGDEAYNFAGGDVIATDDAGNESEWTVLVDGSRLNAEIPPGEAFNEWIALVVDNEAESFNVSVQPLGDIQVNASWNEDLEITFPEV